MAWTTFHEAPNNGDKMLVGTNRGRMFHDWYFEDGLWGDEDYTEEDILQVGEKLTCFFKLPQIPEEFLS